MHLSTSYAILLSLLLAGNGPARAQDTITISNAPNFNNLDDCARSCVDEVAFNVGCSTNTCLCRQDHFTNGITQLKKCTGSECNGDQQDTDDAIAAVTGYCTGLGFTVSDNNSSTPGASQAGSSPSPSSTVITGPNLSPNQAAKIAASWVAGIVISIAVLVF